MIIEGHRESYCSDPARHDGGLPRVKAGSVRRGFGDKGHQTDCPGGINRVVLRRTCRLKKEALHGRERMNSNFLSFLDFFSIVK